MSELTEAEIVEAVRRGRREGQTEMVGRFAKRVFAMIVKQVADEMDAEELMQDTFLRAFDCIDSYNPQRSSLSTWLCCIAYRLTLDYLKRRRTINLTMESDMDVCERLWVGELSSVMEEPDLCTGREERIQRLEKLMEGLADEERLLLTLYYYDDRPLTEIAYIVGTDAKVLAKRLYRLRKKLCRRMKE
jgi:RNA polymerase sigma-70 factor (ECF subfamily)